MQIKDVIDSVLADGEDAFIPARDEKHAESMRVMTFMIRRKMPEILQNDIGIQKVCENNQWFLRVYKREIQGIWKRNKETGQITPVTATVNDPELRRIISMMEADGKSLEEIEEFKKSWAE